MTTTTTNNRISKLEREYNQALYKAVGIRETMDILPAHNITRQMSDAYKAAMTTADNAERALVAAQHENDEEGFSSDAGRTL